MSIGDQFADNRETYGNFNNEVTLLTVSSLDTDQFYMFNSPELFPYGGKLTGHLYSLKNMI